MEEHFLRLFYPGFDVVKGSELFALPFFKDFFFPPHSYTHTVERPEITISASSFFRLLFAQMMTARHTVDSLYLATQNLPRHDT